MTGATGNQGGAVARELLRHGHRVRAMTRKPSTETARALANLGAEVVAGDLDDVRSLEKAVAGVWGVFGVQNTWEAGVAREEAQGKRLAEVARRGGVQHFVYSSVGSANRNTGIPHFENKWQVERTIRRLGFPSYTILRPVFFMENWASPWFKPGLDQGKVMIALKPETALQMVAVQDIGRFGLMAFENHELMNRRELELAGDELTMPDVAKKLSEISGKKLEFTPVPIEAVRQGSADFAAMLEWFDAAGYSAHPASLATDYKIRMTTFSEWARSSRGWR
ncbi:NmrA/HSCARG family protein [Myxococcota bacterium]|nr:NmrA/HSCARG family protein [Myxococcota bacterium]